MNRWGPIAITAILLALTGCGEGGARKDDAPVVVSAIGTRLEGRDPVAAPLDFPQRVLLGATAQGLVRFDAAGQIEPGLAERWIVIDDGRSYIFRLRDARWPDGSEVTAEQVVRALSRAVSANARHGLAPFLAVIDEVVEMTPQVIEVRLKRPRPDLLKLFAQPELAVIRSPGLQGSGPFRAASRRGDLLLTPVREPGIDENATAPEETVRLRAERAAVALARFAARDSDLVLGGSFADWPLVAQAGVAPTNIQRDPAIGLFGLAVVRREGFLADPANRAAIAMGIDRSAITQALLSDWSPTETLLPSQLDSAAAPTQPAWASLPAADRLTTARARVTAWRRAHGGERPEIRIALPSGPGATLLWGQLGASLIRIGVQPLRVGLTEPADLRLIDQVAPYDSGRWFVATACIGCSDEAVALIEAGRAAPDLATRAQRIADADAALTADSAYIPIAQPLRWSVVALRLGGWQRNARAWHPLNHLRNDSE